MSSVSCPLDMTTPQVLTSRRLCGWDTAAMLLAVACILFYYTGVVASDDFGYLRIGGTSPADGANGELSTDWYYLCRFVHWLPVLAAVALPPHHPWMMGIPSLINSIIILLVIRSLARRWLGLSEIATAAAILAWGVMPVVVVSGSVALPDLTSAVLGWLGVYAVAPALLNERIDRPVLRSVAGGLLIALAYNAKETTLGLVPGLILFVLLCRTRSSWAWRRSAWLVVGATAWVVAETIGLWLASGHPLARLESIRLAHYYCHKPDVQMTPLGLLKYWTDYPRWLADPRSEFGVTGPIVLAAAALAIFRRRPASNLLLLMILPTCLYLCVGTADYKHYAPVFHQTRYLLPVLPALALLAGLAVQSLQETRRVPPNLAVIAAAVVILASLPGPNQLSGRASHAQCFMAGYELVAESAPLREPSARLVCSGLTRNRFEFLPTWLNCPKIETALPAPGTADEWVDRYGGAYVLTTRFDRFGDGLAKHEPLTLHGSSLDALMGFQKVDRREPVQDRLSGMLARLTGRPAPTVPGLAVELWHVPTRTEWSNRSAK